MAPQPRRAGYDSSFIAALSQHGAVGQRRPCRGQRLLQRHGIALFFYLGNSVQRKMREFSSGQNPASEPILDLNPQNATFHAFATKCAARFGVSNQAPAMQPAATTRGTNGFSK